MLDNLRDQASSSPLFQENAPKPDLPDRPKPPKVRRSFDQITGMTALQRFTLVFMLFIIVCLLGVTLLILTNKVVLPFL
jgi:hypothetical protein